MSIPTPTETLNVSTTSIVIPAQTISVTIPAQTISIGVTPPPPPVTGPAIVDEAGNVWAIAAGQITVNGVVDATTANVVKLGYVLSATAGVAPLIVQENAAGGYWSKAAPADPWTATTNPFPA